jgi:hypothetical protein
MVADGRELWMLADKYEVDGVKQWLVKHAINMESVCAAAQFACACVDGLCDGMLESCKEHASRSLPRIKECDLAGVGLAAATELLSAHVQNGYLGRPCDVVEGFKFVQRWSAAQRSMPGSIFSDQDVMRQARSLSELLDLEKLPHTFLLQHVKPSGLVADDRVWSLFESVLNADKDAHSTAPIKSIKNHANVLASGIKLVSNLAVGGCGDKERVAIIERGTCQVYVFQLETMKHIMTVGEKGQGQGQFMRPLGAAFDGRGQLIVSDGELNRIQVFDTDGKYVRSFGQHGAAEGDFDHPTYIAMSSEGHIIVCDSFNLRVKVVSEYGEVIRFLGLPEEQIQPYRVAVSADCSILILNSLCNCVKMFNNDGTCTRSIPFKYGCNSAFTIAAGKDRLFAKCYRNSTPIYIIDLTGKSADVSAQDFDQSLICLSSTGCLITY